MTTDSPGRAGRKGHWAAWLGVALLVVLLSGLDLEIGAPRWSGVVSATAECGESVAVSLPAPIENEIGGEAPQAELRATARPRPVPRCRSIRERGLPPPRAPTA